MSLCTHQPLGHAGRCANRATWTGEIDGVQTARCDAHAPPLTEPTPDELVAEVSLETVLLLSRAAIIGVAAGVAIAVVTFFGVGW